MPQRGRVTSRDFNGSSRPAGGRGADENVGGWGDDGYWREPASDAASGDAALTGAGAYNASSGGSRGSATGGRGFGGGRYGSRAGAGTGYASQDTVSSGYGNGSNGYSNGGGDYQTAGYSTGPGDPAGPGRQDRGLRGPGRRGPRRAGAGQPRVKKKGDWWRRWTWKKACGVLGASVGAFVLLVGGLVYYEYSNTQVPTAALAADTFQQSTVYFNDGKTVVGKFGSIDRHIVPISQIPKVMQDAAIAAEDRGFYTEGGISVTGIARAAASDIFGGGNSLQGGSTITQQFVRQYYSGIGTQQTMSRKIKEIFISMKISKEKSKQWILQQYLNTIYLGDGAYGVGAAAETYFHIPVQKLNAAQAAVIAAIIQQPNNFPQPQFRNDLIGRWHYVLDGMVKMGDMTAAQAAAMKFPKFFSNGPQDTVGNEPWDPYILEQVRNELVGIYHLDQSTIDNGGLKIITTVSPTMSASLYHAVNYNLKLMRDGGGPLPWYGMVGAELQDPHTGAILAEYPGRGQNMSPQQCKKYLCDLNTAAYAREQVGSSFKPYVLMEAVKQGMNVRTSILNGFSPLWIPLDSQPMTLASRSQAGAGVGWFRVHNDNNESLGAMRVSNAEAQSSNTAFTDLIHRVGTKNVVQLASQMGVETQASGLQNDVGHVGMALGQDSLTVNEQDTMLSTIANNGMYHQAHVISKIINPTAGTTTPAKVASFQVLTAAQDSQVQYGMEFDTVNGTGTAAAMTDGRQIIAKTGTTTNFHSAFFIGAIPQAALTVGIRTQDQNDKTRQSLQGLGGNMSGGGFGGYWPARIWNTFMEDMYANTTPERFQNPVFTGDAWNQVGKLPKPHKKHHHTPPPTPGPHHHKHPGPRPTVTTSTTASPTATASPTCTAGNVRKCKTVGPGTGAAQQAASISPMSGIQAGAAVGGVLALLPVTLAWNKLSNKRRRKQRASRPVELSVALGRGRAPNGRPSTVGPTPPLGPGFGLHPQDRLHVCFQPADVVGQALAWSLADSGCARGADDIDQQCWLDGA